MQEIKQAVGNITGVYTAPLQLTEDFLPLASRFADMSGTVLLMSGGDLDCARHHILGIRPWLTLSGRGHRMTVQTGTHSFERTADPFDLLREILQTFSLKGNAVPDPVAAGLTGYLSYDLKDVIERLPRTSADDMGLPHIWMAAPSILLIHDKETEQTRIHIPQRTGSDPKAEQAWFEKHLKAFPPNDRKFSGNAQGFRSNFKKPVYLEAIQKIREYIAAGHVYQVNMSQRFQTEFEGDPFGLFQALYEKNPAPFFAYVNAGDHHIISTSPERFILQKKRFVETRPIKGTRPRGKTPEEDRAMADELQNSRKDDAELSMIVDLLRNDIGKVCREGSVRVAAHKRLEAYRNVYHLVSDVVGELDEDKDSVDLIRATFPGGSITGCPKIRSMEIIDEMEPIRRHIYTGSIGYISFHDTMDLNIAIRTATILNDRMIFSVGGGIVYDSDPADEFDETLHKGQTLMSVFQGKADRKYKQIPSYVWMNGSLVLQNDAAVPLMSPGVQYGHGFFETIRVDKGRPLLLDEHLKRFEKAWKTLFGTFLPDLTWNDIIAQVIEADRLAAEKAAVKIMALKGKRNEPPFEDALIVTARLYVHRLEGKKDKGIHLLTYPHSRQTPLADHKTLNYLYYLKAGEWAKANGGDEALILNPDSTVSETNTASLLLVKGRRIISPVSPHVLPGVMEASVIDYIKKTGWEMTEKPLKVKDLYDADEVLLTNSLMGAVPVLSLDGKNAGLPSDLWVEINRALLKPDAAFPF